MEKSQEKEIIDPVEPTELEGSQEPHETDDPKETEELDVNDEPELKLPDWIKPDPGEGDKGKLLYIEEWAKERKFKKPWETLVDILTGTIGGIALIGIAIFVGHERVSDGFSVAFPSFITFLFFGLFLIWFEWFCYKDHVRRMPLCIYENGFSNPWLSRNEASKRQELFIPWFQLDQMCLKESVKKDSYKLSFYLTQEKYPSSITISTNEKDALLKIFNQMIPEKIRDDIQM